MNVKILSIAGSDSIGGAGIQADIKAITYFGGHATVAITAVTVQDLDNVYNIHYVPVNIIREQIKVVLKNGVAAVKIGMLGNIEIANVVFETLAHYPTMRVIMDPVFVATCGAKLLTDSAIEVIRSKFLSMSYIITPNVPEAEVLLGMKINNIEDMIAAGISLSKLGNCFVLIKGAHLFPITVIDSKMEEEKCSGQIIDVFVTPDLEVHFFQNPKINAPSHGTGCALSSAIATLISQNLSFEEAIPKAIDYVRAKIYADLQTFSVAAF